MAQRVEIIISASDLASGQIKVVGSSLATLQGQAAGAQRALAGVGSGANTAASGLGATGLGRSLSITQGALMGVPPVANAAASSLRTGLSNAMSGLWGHFTNLHQAPSIFRSVAGAINSELGSVLRMVQGVGVAMAVFYAFQLPSQLIGSALTLNADLERLELTIQNLAAVEIMEASGVERSLVVGQRRAELSEKETKQLETQTDQLARLKEQLDDAIFKRETMTAQGEINVQKDVRVERDRAQSLRDTALAMKEQELRIGQLTARWGPNGIDTLQAIERLNKLKAKYDDLQNPIDTHTLSVTKSTQAYSENEEKIAALQVEIGKTEGAVGKLTGKEGQLVDVIKKVKEGQMTMNEAMAQAGPKAVELLKWIKELAIQSPFKRETVASTLQMGMAYGMTTEQAKKYTQALADYGAGTGRSEYQTRLLAMAMGQVWSKGRLYAEEMNQQLTEAGMGISFVAKALDMTTKELTAAMKEGKISAEMFFDAVEKRTDKLYGGAAARMATSWAGLMSTMGDLWDYGILALFGPTLEVIQPLLATFVKSWEGQEKAIQKVGDALGRFVSQTLVKFGDAIKGFQTRGVRGFAEALGFGPDLAFFIDNAVRLLGTLAGAIRDGLGDAWNFFNTTIVPVMNGALKTMNENWGDVETVIRGVVKVLTAEALGAALLSLLGIMKLFTDPLLIAVAVGGGLALGLDKLQEYFGGANSKANDLNKGITDLADTHLPWLKESWEGTMDDMRGRSDEATDAILENFRRISEGPAPVLDRSHTSNVDAIRAQERSMEDVGMQIEILLGSARMRAEQVFTGIWKDMERIGGYMQQGAGVVWQRIVDDTVWFFTLLWNTIIRIGEEMVEKAKWPFAMLVAGIMDMLTGFVGAFLQIWLFIFDALAALFQDRHGELQGMMDKFLADMLKSLKTFGLGFVEALAGIYFTAVGLTEGFVLGIWKALQKGWQDIYDKLVGHSIIPDLIDEILRLFGEVPGKLKGIGQDMVKGLIEGMAGLYDALFNRLWDAVSSALDDLKKRLGIASPSTVMAAIGESMAQGLIDGLSATLPGMGDVVTKELGQVLHLFREWGGVTQGEMEKFAQSMGNIPLWVVQHFVRGFGRLPTNVAEWNSYLDRINVRDAEGKLWFPDTAPANLPPATFNLGRLQQAGILKGFAAVGSEMSGVISAAGNAFRAAMERIVGGIDAGVVDRAAKSTKDLTNALQELLGSAANTPAMKRVFDVLGKTGEMLGELAAKADIVGQVKDLVGGFESLGLALPPDLLASIIEISKALGGPFEEAIKAFLGLTEQRAALKELEGFLSEFELGSQLASAVSGMLAAGLKVPQSLLDMLRDMERTPGGYLDWIIRQLLVVEEENVGNLRRTGAGVVGGDRGIGLPMGAGGAVVVNNYNLSVNSRQESVGVVEDFAYLKALARGW